MWTRIAGERESFTVSGTQTVRYGADTRWIQKAVTGSGTCSSTWFGGDPAYGVVKSCQVQSAPASQVPLVTPGTWSVIGSSTAQGVGSTAGHAWVDLMRNDNASRGVTVSNFGVGGSVTYKGLSVSAAVAGKPTPDPLHNIDAAMALGSKLVILNYPSNDLAAGYTADETVNNYLSIRNSGTQGGAITIAISTQPQRWVPNGAFAQTVADTDLRLAAAFGPCFVAVRSALALPDGSLNPAYDSGDGQHLNDAGHALVYSLVKATLTSGQCVRL
jgi:lysophospholipase L1-like esterase